MSVKLVKGGVLASELQRAMRKVACALVSQIPFQFRHHLVAPVVLVVAIAAAGLSGCSVLGTKSSDGLSPRVVEYGQPVPKGGGRYKIGKPYKADGQWYHPKEDPYYDRTGTASWYGDLFHGRYTANGEIYDMDALTAAHPTLPLPVYAKVTNLRNGRSLVVRVNDRGPYRHNRVIDLSRKSANILGFLKDGTAPVRVQYLGRAPLNGDDRYERHYLAQQRWRGGQFASRKSDFISTSAVDRIRMSSARPQEPVGRPINERFFVQAGAFRDGANAEKLRARLSQIGPARVEPMTTRQGVLYRVSVGPYKDSYSADVARGHIVQSGLRDAVLVKR